MVEKEPELVNLMDCYFQMINDQGLSVDDVDFAEAINDLHEDITIEMIGKANDLLGKLTSEERETLAIGDQDDWPPILEKMGPDYPIVTRVLEELFERMGDF